jgi:hypothetical protein
MPDVEIEITAAEPFANGEAFGEAGPYLRIRGLARGELDPRDPANRVIADLDRAPCSERGLVAWESDFFVLRPADPSRGRGILIYDVTNRGRKMINSVLDDAVGEADTNDPKARKDVGLAFTLGRGYSLLWSGWDPGAPRANNGMTARLPIAVENGMPMVRRVRDEFHIGTRAPGKGEVVRLNYPAVSTDTRRARLAFRERERDPRRDIPPDAWEFVDERSIRLLPPGSNFAPIGIWEIWYEATESPVIGIGFAAVRDLVAHLRYAAAGAGNPLGGGVSHALAFGVSQAGRFLRHFLELGMNDKDGRGVFDGVFTHVAGAGKTFANHSFAMPGRTATQHEDRLYPENWFPFGNMRAADPFSGKTGAILSGRASDPCVIEVNTSTEYWQKGASLVHTDPLGREDAALPSSTRVYMIAGTQHGGRAGTDASPGPCANPRNPHSATPALRALFTALEAWVADGVMPPPSRAPQIADGTAIPAEEIRMPAVPGFTLAPGANPIGPPVDWVEAPLESGAVYGTLVSAVDADGNELAGIRLPPIAVPLGTYTGWNVYRTQPCELCDRDGSLIPFARSREQRERAGDPRPSLAERYGSRETYLARLKAATEALVAERLLLPEDAPAYLRAAASCDAF